MTRIARRHLQVHDLAGAAPVVRDEHLEWTGDRRRGRVQAVPLGEEAVVRVERAAEVTAGEERRAAAIVEDRQRKDEAAHPAAQRRPARAVPLRDVGRWHATRGLEVATRIERLTAAIVEDRQTPGARQLHPARQGRPARAVPPRDPVCRHAARSEEVATGIEQRTVAVVEDGQRLDCTVFHSAAQRRPARAGPLRNAARRHAAGDPEAPARIEGWTAAVVEAVQRKDDPPSTPLPRGDQLNPSHLAIPFAATPPAVVNLPPAKSAGPLPSSKTVSA